MEVRAHLRYLRIAPRKVRLVINLIRGLDVDKAIDQLTILPKRSAQPVLKLLNSAIANAEHNFQLDRKTLVVKTIVANEGPRLKRFQPRAFGRAGEILKRSSHISIVLDGKAKAKPAKVAEDKPAAVKASDVKRAPAKPALARAAKPKISKPTDKEQQRTATDVTVPRKGKD